jgi:hypothetical protein
MDGLRLVLSLDYMDETWESIKSRDFDGCLEVQRIVYIIQLGGVRLGYRFSWDPATSPYCEELAAKLEDLPPGDGQRLRGLGSLKPAAEKKLDRVKPLLQPPEGMTRAGWLELVTSVHFLLHIAYVPPAERAGTPKPETLDDRKASIRRFLEEDLPVLAGTFDVAWRALDGVGLVKAKALSDGYVFAGKAAAPAEVAAAADQAGTA